MNLSTFSIKRPVFAWMIMFGLIIFGAVSLQRLGVSYMPDVDFPVLSVRVSWPGAAPELMEAELIDRIERKLVVVEGLKELRSSVRQGAATIDLEFDIDRNVDVALQEVQAALGSMRWPNDVDPPYIRKTNPDEDPIMWIGLSGDKTLHDLFVYADQNLVDRLQLLPGVGEVMLGGSMERNLRVWVDNEKLNKYDLTILDVQDSIRLEHSESAAGYLENSSREQNLRVQGEALTTDEIASIRITKRGGSPILFSPIRIRDIANVVDGLNDVRRITRVSGKEGLSIGIKKQKGSNMVAVGDAVRREIEEIKKTLPPNHDLKVVFDSTAFVREAVAETEFTLILSALLTAAVCWIFLGNWSSTINVLLSIPTSIIGTFLILYFAGFTLNLFTLLALSLAIGIVVDDAIMILENIMRHFDMGKDRVTAAKEGASQIIFAAIAATIAVIAVFLPVAFMEGIIGKFFFQFGVTISGAVALSLLEAVTLTPMRASQLLYKQKHEFTLIRWFRIILEKAANLYESLLSISLRHRAATLIVSAIIFGLSLIFLKYIRIELVPSQDQSQFGVAFIAPVGSSLETTSEKMKQFEDAILERSEMEGYVAIVGGFGGGESNRGMLFATMKDKEKRDMSQSEFMNLCRNFLKSIPGLRGILMDFSSRGLTPRRSFPVEFSIRGSEWSELKRFSDEISERMRKSGLFRDLDVDYREGMPEVRVIPDREAASARGVGMDSLVRTVAAAMGGVREGRFTNDSRRYDIRIRLKEGQWRGPEDVKKIKIRNAYGELVSLGSVARIENVPTVQTLTRIDRQRAISFSANLAEGKSQADALAEAEKISREVITEGYSYYTGGGSRGFSDSFDSLIFALWLGILVAYMVLAAQFNSFLHPVSVLLALPFSVTGTFAALFLAGKSLNLYSMIGIVLLMGIAKKNSILLVEFANEMRREERLPVFDALLAAGKVRLRPILMTSFSTIAAALPPALAFGPGAESRIPMAIAVIGGMVVSTLFTLFVVPCAYSLLSRFER